MKYIASCSFGKDSIATILLAHIHNEPLDVIVFSEVMFDKNTSGEHPKHIDWIKNVAIPKINELGYEVKILHSNKTYLDCFYNVCGERAKPERIGKLRGFPIAFKCKINSDCKVKPIKDFYKSIDEPVIQYVGIAIDEPERLERLKGTNKTSLLKKYNYTERMALELCKKYDLLSPIYEVSSRGGCWFCPNCKMREWVSLYENYPELWERLKLLSKTPNLVTEKFNRTLTFEQLENTVKTISEAEKAQLRLAI